MRYLPPQINNGNSTSHTKETRKHPSRLRLTGIIQEFQLGPLTAVNRNVKVTHVQGFWFSSKISSGIQHSKTSLIQGVIITFLFFAIIFAYYD